jgi:hypothetical protein
MYTSTDLQTSAIIEVSNELVEKAEIVGRFFDGSTPTQDGLVFSWVGTANASASIATGSKPANWAASVATDFIWRDPDNVGAIVYHPTNGIQSWFFGTFPADPDAVMTTAMTFEVPIWAPASMSVFFATRSFTAGGSNLTYIETSRVVLQPGESVRISQTRTLEPDAAQFRVSIYANGIGYCRVRDVFSGVGEDGSYFDGSTPDSDNYYHSWLGAADASQSVVNTWN